LNDLVFNDLSHRSWFAALIVEVKVLFLKPEEEKDKTHFTDKEVNIMTADFPLLVA